MTSSPTEHSESSKRDELEILTREEQRCEAVSKTDLAALAELLADDLTHTHVNGLVETKTEYLSKLGSRPRVVTRLDLTVQVLGDVALMRGILENRFPGMSAEDSVPQLQVLQVWVRRETWQQLVFSASGPIGSHPGRPGAGGPAASGGPTAPGGN